MIHYLANQKEMKHLKTVLEENGYPVNLVKCKKERNENEVDDDRGKTSASDSHHPIHERSKRTNQEHSQGIQHPNCFRIRPVLGKNTNQSTARGQNLCMVYKIEGEAREGGKSHQAGASGMQDQQG